MPLWMILLLLLATLLVIGALVCSLVRLGRATVVLLGVATAAMIVLLILAPLVAPVTKVVVADLKRVGSDIEQGFDAAGKKVKSIF